MNEHWCDQAEIMESITAQGCPRGCLLAHVAAGTVLHSDQLVLITQCLLFQMLLPGRDYGIYLCSGAPEGML